MAKTVQNIIDLAGQQELAADQDTLLQDTYEVLSALQDRSTEIRRGLSRFVPFYYTVAKDFDVATGGYVDLTDIGAGEYLPIALRLVKLEDGTEVQLVDEVRQGEQPAPRAFLRGTTMYAVGTDWESSTKLQITYVRKPVALDLTGGYSQNIDLPDDWTRPLVDWLTGYIAEKDGRAEDAQRWYVKSDMGVTRLADQLAQLYGLERQRVEVV
jgi:hypothetical protein